MTERARRGCLTLQVRRPLNFSEGVRRVAKILRGAFREPLKSGSRGPESAKIWPPGAKFRSPPAAAHVTSAVASAFHSSASDRTPLPLTPPPVTSPSDASDALRRLHHQRVGRFLCRDALNASTATSTATSTAATFAASATACSSSCHREEAHIGGVPRSLVAQQLFVKEREG